MKQDVWNDSGMSGGSSRLCARSRQTDSQTERDVRNRETLESDRFFLFHTLSLDLIDWWQVEEPVIWFFPTKIFLRETKNCYQYRTLCLGHCENAKSLCYKTVVCVCVCVSAGEEPLTVSCWLELVQSTSEWLRRLEKPISKRAVATAPVSASCRVPMLWEDTFGRETLSCLFTRREREREKEERERERWGSIRSALQLNGFWTELADCPRHLYTRDSPGRPAP